MIDAGSSIFVRRPRSRYCANRSCPIFGELAAILRKTVGLADVLRDALEPLGARVSVAFVFGSVARGEERAGSDVDVLVVGRISFTAVVKALSSAEKTIHREVNPVVLKRSELQDRLASGDVFLERILQDPKIYVKGSEDDLGELVQGRKAPRS
ncbi:MAG: nucleotidyltransferase domain-containing protein [bacterium]